MNKKNIEDVIIIGSGPAGISAAIYLLRAGINPLIIEKESPGGKLNKTFRIENYPGYTDKEGTTLAFRMYDQLEKLNANIKIESVADIQIKEDNIVVITNKAEYSSKYIILSTGRTPRKLDCKNADKYENKGISYCATCDGALFKNKDVIIVGGGNSAFETANYLSKMVKSITILNRTDTLKATQKEQDEVLQLDNVKILYNMKIKEVKGNETGVTEVILDNKNTIKTDGIFVCIGQDATDNYYQGLKLDSDKLGIKVDCDMKTSNDYVYACGDSISKKLYQVVTATSEGAIAATSIIGKLRSK